MKKIIIISSLLILLLISLFVLTGCSNNKNENESEYYYTYTYTPMIINGKIYIMPLSVEKREKNKENLLEED